MWVSCVHTQFRFLGSVQGGLVPSGWPHSHPVLVFMCSVSPVFVAVIVYILFSAVVRCCRNCLVFFTQLCKLVFVCSGRVLVLVLVLVMWTCYMPRQPAALKAVCLNDVSNEWSWLLVTCRNLQAAQHTVMLRY